MYINILFSFACIQAYQFYVASMSVPAAHSQEHLARTLSFSRPYQCYFTYIQTARLLRTFACCLYDIISKLYVIQNIIVHVRWKVKRGFMSAAMPIFQCNKNECLAQFFDFLECCDLLLLSLPFMSCNKLQTRYNWIEHLK